LIRFSVIHKQDQAQDPVRKAKESPLLRRKQLTNENVTEYVRDTITNAKRGEF